MATVPGLRTGDNIVVPKTVLSEGSWAFNGLSRPIFWCERFNHRLERKDLAKQFSNNYNLGNVNHSEGTVRA